MRCCIALFIFLLERTVALRPTSDDTTEVEPARAESAAQQHVSDPRFKVSEEAKAKLMKIIDELNDESDDKLWTHIDFESNTGWEYQAINRFSPSGPEAPGPLEALVSHLLFRHGLALAYASSPRWFPLFQQWMNDPSRKPKLGEKRLHWAMNTLASFCIHLAEALEDVGLPALRQFHDMDNQWALSDPQEQAELLRNAHPDTIDKADPDDVCSFQAGRSPRVSEAALLLEITGGHAAEVFEEFLHYQEEVSNLNLKGIKGFSLHECFTSVKAEGAEELVLDSLKLATSSYGKKTYAQLTGKLRFANGYMPDFELRLTDEEIEKMPTDESAKMEKLAELARKRLRLWTVRYEEITAAHRENTWANELMLFVRRLPAVQEQARRMGERL